MGKTLAKARKKAALTTATDVENGCKDNGIKKSAHYTALVSEAFDNEEWEKAEKLLRSMVANSLTPKLGAIQRWVRSADLSGNEAWSARLLAAIIEASAFTATKAEGSAFSKLYDDSSASSFVPKAFSNSMKSDIIIPNHRTTGTESQTPPNNSTASGSKSNNKSGKLVPIRRYPAWIPPPAEPWIPPNPLDLGFLEEAIQCGRLGGFQCPHCCGGAYRTSDLEDSADLRRRQILEESGAGALIPYEWFFGSTAAENPDDAKRGVEDEREGGRKEEDEEGSKENGEKMTSDKSNSEITQNDRNGHASTTAAITLSPRSTNAATSPQPFKHLAPHSQGHEGQMLSRFRIVPLGAPQGKGREGRRTTIASGGLMRERLANKEEDGKEEKDEEEEEDEEIEEDEKDEENKKTQKTEKNILPNIAQELVMVASVPGTVQFDLLSSEYGLCKCRGQRKGGEAQCLGSESALAESEGEHVRRQDVMDLDNLRAKSVTKIPVPFVPGAFCLTGVLSREECRQIVTAAEAVGYVLDPDYTFQQQKQQLKQIGGGADNGRAVGGLSAARSGAAGQGERGAAGLVWLADAALQGTVWKRVRQYLPQELAGERLAGLNCRWRLYRYDKGGVYRPHVDGAWPGSGLDPEGKYVFDYFGNRWSRLTFLVYLNDDFEGGETTYYTSSREALQQQQPDKGNSKDNKSNPKDNNGNPKDGNKKGEGNNTVSFLEARGVRPCAGNIMVFPHGDTLGCLVHEGSVVTRGAKYVIRTEVLYEKVAARGERKDASKAEPPNGAQVPRSQPQDKKRERKGEGLTSFEKKFKRRK